MTSTEIITFFQQPQFLKSPFWPKIAEKGSNPVKWQFSNLLKNRHLFLAGIKPSEIRHVAPGATPPGYLRQEEMREELAKPAGHCDGGGGDISRLCA